MSSSFSTPYQIRKQADGSLLSTTNLKLEWPGKLSVFLLFVWFISFLATVPLGTPIMLWLKMAGGLSAAFIAIAVLGAWFIARGMRNSFVLDARERTLQQAKPFALVPWREIQLPERALLWHETYQYATAANTARIVPYYRLLLVPMGATDDEQLLANELWQFQQEQREKLYHKHSDVERFPGAVVLHLSPLPNTALPLVALMQQGMRWPLLDTVWGIQKWSWPSRQNEPHMHNEAQADLQTELQAKLAAQGPVVQLWNMQWWLIAVFLLVLVTPLSALYGFVASLKGTSFWLAAVPMWLLWSSLLFVRRKVWASADGLRLQLYLAVVPMGYAQFIPWSELCGWNLKKENRWFLTADNVYKHKTQFRIQVRNEAQGRQVFMLFDTYLKPAHKFWPETPGLAD